MKTFSIPTLALLTLGAAFAQTASAADLPGSGGGRGYGSGGVVAVPAPIPYEETYKWYIRGDIGATVARSGDLSATGLPIPGLQQPEDWGTTGLVSIGMGRYVTPSLRTELSLDMRKIRRVDTYSNTFDWTTPTMAVTGGTAYNTYQVSRNENIDVRNNTLMLSAFYDLNRGGKITPYVGAGIGIAMHTLYRQSSETSACSDGLFTDGTTGLTTPGCNAEVSAAHPNPVVNSTDQHTGFGLAAQLAAGVSVALSPRVHWDTGYHMIWQQGKVAISNNSVAGFSTIKIGDVIHHEVRTGIRWDLW